MQWSPSDVSASASEDFEAEWMKTIDLAPSGSYSPKPPGKPQQEAELVQRLRQLFLGSGYSEASLPVFVDEAEARMQRGPEARLAILDSYAVSSFPRAPSPPAKGTIEKIRVIAPSFTEEKLEELHALAAMFSSGDLDAESLLSSVVEKTGVRMDQASEIVSLFFTESSPSATGLLLRNGLVESWFETLAALTKKEAPPLQLFSIGLGFRRGAPGYLASGAVVSESVSIEDGQSLVSSFLTGLGLDSSFQKVAATSKLFIPGTELVVSCRGRPVGRLGLLSPIALSGYGLSTPVFVFELIVARLGVLLGLASEEKELHHPQFFGEWVLPDAEIASMVHVAKSPSSWGRELAAKIIKTCSVYSMQPAPCEFKLLEKEIGDNKLEVWLVADKGTLCGKDFGDEVFVHDGSLVSSPAMGATQLQRDAVAGGVRTGISLVSAFADYAACLIESAPVESQRVELATVSDPADVNIAVPELVRRYAESKNKSLAVSGVVGLCVESRVKRLWRHEQPRRLA